MKNFYCPNCETEQVSKVIIKEETLNIRGQLITCTIKVRVCSKCGEEILDRNLDNESLQKFYNEYKKKNNLLLPLEIKKIRNKYHLSQSTFAKLLGFGEKTITRYENGAIQDFAHDNLLRVMESVEEFEKIWNLRKQELTTTENTRIKNVLKMSKPDHMIIIPTSSTATWNSQSIFKQQNNYNYTTRRVNACSIASLAF